jgi:hypothetical protein
MWKDPPKVIKDILYTKAFKVYLREKLKTRGVYRSGSGS